MNKLKATHVTPRRRGRHPSHTSDDVITTRTRFASNETYPAPNEYATVPQVTGDYLEDAKFTQKAVNPRLKTLMLGHLAVNEMADQADDGTNYLGYTNDN